MGSETSKVIMFDGNDPEMQAASEKARATFKYFWRELAWERRRIVPGLDMACVKAPFSDATPDGDNPDKPQVEHMWISDVDFNGKRIKGTLINSPNWLKSVKEGDTVRLHLAQLADWMYAISGVVYGGYTVNLMRARMKPAERKAHDAAWGLNFGDPAKIRVVPAKKEGGFLKGLFGGGGGGGEEVIGEHPMSENMGPSLREHLQQHPGSLNEKDELGWTMLHHQALAGSRAAVEILLDAGADVKALTGHRMTARQLAQSLGWTEVSRMIKEKGG